RKRYSKGVEPPCPAAQVPQGNKRKRQSKGATQTTQPSQTSQAMSSQTAQPSQTTQASQTTIRKSPRKHTTSTAQAAPRKDKGKAAPRKAVERTSTVVGSKKTLGRKPSAIDKWIP
ncbi:hypothetical protein FRX31_034540, partial [Thalictrum thalictroides]